MTRLLLLCGLLASIVYVATDLAAAALFYPGYDYTAQQVSELSAIGAPSRPFWMLLAYPYSLLTAAFGVGVWRAAGTRLLLRIAAALIVAFAANGFVWGLVAPMHMRGTTFTASDSLHIAFAVAAVLLMLAFMVSGAIVLGRGFRIYTALTIAAMLAAGGIVGTQISAIAENRPTPWMGLVERISVYGPMLWIAVFAVILAREATEDRPLAQVSPAP